jgi:hypothetical protein
MRIVSTDVSKAMYRGDLLRETRSSSRLVMLGHRIMHGKLEPMVRRHCASSSVSEDIVRACIEIGILYSWSLHAPRIGIRWFRRAIEARPKSAMAWAELGEAFYLLGKYDEAVKVLHKAMKLDKDAGRAEDFIERCLEDQRDGYRGCCADREPERLAMGRFQESLNSLRWHKTPESFHLRAQAFLALGRHKEALLWLERYIQATGVLSLEREDFYFATDRLWFDPAFWDAPLFQEYQVHVALRFRTLDPSLQSSAWPRGLEVRRRAKIEFHRARTHCDIAGLRVLRRRFPRWLEVRRMTEYYEKHKCLPTELPARCLGLLPMEQLVYRPRAVKASAQRQKGPPTF